VKGIELNRSFVSSFCWAAVAAMMCLFIIGGPVSKVVAQDDGAAKAEDAPAAGGDEKKADAKPQESFLAWMIRASGIFGFLIMLVSFVMVAIIMMIGLQLRRDNFLPASFVEQFEQRLQAKDYQGAYEAAKGSDSFIGRVLSAGMARLTRGLTRLPREAIRSSVEFCPPVWPDYHAVSKKPKLACRKSAKTKRWPWNTRLATWP